MTKEKKPKTRAKKILDIVLNIVSVLLVILVILVVVSKVTGARIFSRSVLWVMTESMEPEIPRQSYILVEAVDAEDVKVNDIIAFRSSDPALAGQLNTHRVIRIVGNNESFITKGDNNLVEDAYSVRPIDVEGRYVRRLPLLSMFRKNGGPIAMFAMLILCMVIWIIQHIWQKKAEKEEEAEMDRLVEEAIQQLEQMNFKAKSTAKPLSANSIKIAEAEQEANNPANKNMENNVLPKVPDGAKKENGDADVAPGEKVPDRENGAKDPVTDENPPEPSEEKPVEPSDATVASVCSGNDKKVTSEDEATDSPAPLPAVETPAKEEVKTETDTETKEVPAILAESDDPPIFEFAGDAETPTEESATEAEKPTGSERPESDDGTEAKENYETDRIFDIVEESVEVVVDEPIFESVEVVVEHPEPVIPEIEIVEGTVVEPVEEIVGEPTGITVVEATEEIVGEPSDADGDALTEAEDEDKADTDGDGNGTEGAETTKTESI